MVMVSARLTRRWRLSGKLPRWARSFPCMRCLLTAFGSPDDEELGKLRKRAPPN
jgi:hypothetical protein